MKFILNSILLLVVIFVLGAQAGIYKYSNEKVNGDQFTLRMGIFDPEDSPSRSSPGNGRAFIKFDMSFDRSGAKQDGPSQITALMFMSEEIKHVGLLMDDGKRHFCCSKELFEQQKCSQVGHVITDKEPGNDFMVTNVNFYHNESNPSMNVDTAQLQQTVNITESGIYYVFFVKCPDSGVGETVKMSGTIVVMNPYGYLPGELWYQLPFYGVLALSYLAVGFAWMVLSIKHWKQLLTIQNYIAGVIALGMIETATLYFDDLGYNISGENYVGAMIVGVIVSTIKRTISRLLVLVVSMGYGVVKPTLGQERYKIFLLGGLYFIFSGILNIMELVQRTPAFTTPVVLFLVFPVAVFDTIFYWWIFLSLLRTIQQLTVRKQTIKLGMYKTFFGTLIVSGIVSSIMIIAQLFVSITTNPDEIWRSLWVWSAFWHVLYFAILVAIVILWRPTSNNTRYAYSEVPEVSEEEITLQPISAIGEIVQRKKEDNKDEDPSKINQVSLEMPSLSFSIDDEDEKEAEMERNKLD